MNLLRSFPFFFNAKTHNDLLEEIAKYRAAPASGQKSWPSASAQRSALLMLRFTRKPRFLAHRATTETTSFA